VGAERLASEQRETPHRLTPQGRDHTRTPRPPTDSSVMVVASARRHEAHRTERQALRVQHLPKSPLATNTTTLHLQPTMPRLLRRITPPPPTHPTDASRLFNVFQSRRVAIASFTTANSTAEQAKRTQQARSRAVAGSKSSRR
jgi:hypothetical protein